MLDESTLIWQSNSTRYSAVGETLSVTAWGTDSLRVRASPVGIDADYLGALLPLNSSKAQVHARSQGQGKRTSTRGGVRVTTTAVQGSLVNGNIRADIDEDGFLTVTRVSDGVVILSEVPRPFDHAPSARRFQRSLCAGQGDNSFRASYYYNSVEEKIFGMGQHTHGRLDQKGLEIELEQINTRITIPFAVSSHGYGFLWNTPAAGSVVFGLEYSRWTAESVRQIDYWITTCAADTPAPLTLDLAHPSSHSSSRSAYADILSNFADATGHAPMLPNSASGACCACFSRVFQKQRNSVFTLRRGFNLLWTSRRLLAIEGSISNPR